MLRMCIDVANVTISFNFALVASRGRERSAGYQRVSECIREESLRCYIGGTLYRSCCETIARNHAREQLCNRMKIFIYLTHFARE